MAVMPEGLTIRIGEKPMRDIRKDITFGELDENGITPDQVHSLYCQYRYDGVATKGIPDSFYEQPPVGQFGKFWNDGAFQPRVWGHIGTAEDPCKFYCYDTEKSYDNFTPGLPTDVDENGYPKE